MKRNWHPYAEKFPFLKGEEKKALKESLKATKGNKDQPILYRKVKGKREYLDGRNRADCCDELGITPKDRLVNVKDDEVKDFVIRHNITRRHLDAETRQALVADLRADGKSERQIAETLSVSQPTVHRDILATDSNESVDDSTALITGKDGRKRRAKAGPTKRVAKTTTGAPIIDWKEFFNHFGFLVRAVGRVGKAYYASDSQAAKSLESKLTIFKAEFTRWVEFHTKEKAPSH